MKASKRIAELADQIRVNGNKCRARDPLLSASLRNIAHELRAFSCVVAAFETEIERKIAVTE